MRWFRRKRGRHALGAPKRAADPVVVAAVVPFVPLPVVSNLSFHLAAPTPTVGADDLLGSIAALSVSGEAWVGTPVLPAQGTTAPTPVAAQEMTFAPVVPVPVQLPTVVALAPSTAGPVSRVQLGFRDGTTASLDPDSEQSAALEELALLLSLRD